MSAPRPAGYLQDAATDRSALATARLDTPLLAIPERLPTRSVEIGKER